MSSEARNHAISARFSWDTPFGSLHQPCKKPDDCEVAMWKDHVERQWWEGEVPEYLPAVLTPSFSTFPVQILTI